MHALNRKDEDNHSHVSWQPTNQRLNAAVIGPAAGQPSSSSTTPIPAPCANTSVPIIISTPAITMSDTPVDIGAAHTSWDNQWNKLHNNIQRLQQVSPTVARKVLLLCAGPDDRFDGLTQLIKAAGFVPENFDTANGAQFDLVDDAISDPIAVSVAGGEYVAAIASPDCSTY